MRIRDEVAKLLGLLNVGKAGSADLLQIGMSQPEDLIGHFRHDTASSKSA